jgi:Uma2 family endonuclease
MPTTEVQLTEAPVQTEKMSYEAYLALPDDVRAEWKDGEVTILMPVKDNHQPVVEFLLMLLGLYVQALQLGRTRTAPFEVRLSPQGPSREPDLFFAATSSLDRWTNDRFIGGPDLVVEVISKESIGCDRGDKFYEYQEAGVREYWIIDSRAGHERADFYVLDNNGQFQPALPDDGGRYHSVVVPGFVLQLSWLWEDPAPSIFVVAPQLAAESPAFADALQRMAGV